MTYVVNTLDDGLPFGKRVIGLGYADLACPDVRAELSQLWTEAGMLLFEGSDVTPEFQVALSEVFGELMVHPVGEVVDSVHSQLMTLNAQWEKTGLYNVNGVDVVGYTPWHLDLIWSDKINRGGILTAKEITSWGGQTGFIDRAQAFDKLSPDLRERLTELEIVYRLSTNMATSRFGIEDDVRTVRVGEYEEAITQRLDRDYPLVVHPASFVHPDSRRPVLNVSPLGAQYIVGLDDEESERILGVITDCLLASPKYYHSWKPNQMILWDNWRMLHSVTGAPPNERRVMQRTTIQGDYGLGRRLTSV